MKDHRDFPPANGSHFIFRKVEKISSSEADFSSDDFARWMRDELQNRKGSNRFSASCLSHQAKCSAFLDIETHSVEGPYGSARGVKMGFQIFNTQECAHFHKDRIAPPHPLRSAAKAPPPRAPVRRAGMERRRPPPRGGGGERVCQSLSLGSSESLSPSPKRLKPITTSMIASPGTVATCGAVIR